jgi:5S rRNA maturation endonuclease (ribonuclease M5)
MTRISSTSTSAILTIAALVASSSILGTALAQTKAGSPKPQDKLAIGAEQAKQLLLLIDTDKSGKISKQEWMKFMEAEFDRLDVEKKRRLDVKELAQSRLAVSHFATAGK